MRKSDRLFEIIQILRGASQPMTAQTLARLLEVSVRTVYRDISGLQAMRTPIEGEAGIGYIMRAGYDLPPLNFDTEEIEALRVGLSMLMRAGDTGLLAAGQRVCAKIDALHGPAEWIQVAPWGAPRDDVANGCVPVTMLRDAVRQERKLSLTYHDTQGRVTTRKVRPIAVIYHLECNMLAAWCELRGGFRHFRLDRIHRCEGLDEYFIGHGPVMRDLWQEDFVWEESGGVSNEADTGDGAAVS